MNGLENLGIRLDIEDFSTIFKVLDYDSKGILDFNKFCLLNTDRSLDYRYLVKEL
jgi:Ca2+-binding EF-hand superfamily protein